MALFEVPIYLLSEIRMYLARAFHKVSLMAKEIYLLCFFLLFFFICFFQSFWHEQHIFSFQVYHKLTSSV